MTEEKKPIVGFLKFLSQAEHLESFLDGHILMRTGAWFRGCERTDDGRHDLNESRCVFLRDQLSSLKVGEHEIIEGVVNVTVDIHAHLLCLGHVTRVTASTPGELVRRIRECASLGFYVAVIRDPAEFCARVVRAAESRGFGWEHGLVTYTDERAPDVPRALFRKGTAFSWQHEYRFAVQGPWEDEYITLEIGAIRDICTTAIVEGKPDE